LHGSGLPIVISTSTSRQRSMPSMALKCATSMFSPGPVSAETLRLVNLIVLGDVAAVLAFVRHIGAGSASIGKIANIASPMNFSTSPPPAATASHIGPI
jgi:hypothetical protein